MCPRLEQSYELHLDALADKVGWAAGAHAEAGARPPPRDEVGRTPCGAAAPALLACALLPEPLAAAAEQPLLKLRPVPFRDVKIQDSFWAPRRETNRVASIPFSLQKLEEAGNLEDMRLAARGATNGFRGPVFMDSDLYKALEAASYSLATHPDPALEKQLDDIIALLAAAQQPDGYLNSYFTVKEPGKRWTNLRDWHELYCAGHMFEAAVAHYQATGKTQLPERRHPVRRLH